MTPSLWRLLQEADTYAESNGMFYMETSAKTADNIQELFQVSAPVWYLGCNLVVLCCRHLRLFMV
jgi:hypothetical protein